MAFGFKNPDTVPDPYAQPVDRKRIFLVIGLIVAVLLSGFLLFSVLSSSGKGDFVALIAKVKSLQTVTEDSQKRVRSSELAKINSELSLLLSTDGNAMVIQLQKRFGQEELTSDETKAGIDPALEKKLTDGELLNKFDFTYQNIMRQKIAEMILSAEELKDSIGGKEFNTAMDTFINNLKAVNSQLEKLNV